MNAPFYTHRKPLRDVESLRHTQVLFRSFKIFCMAETLYQFFLTYRFSLKLFCIFVFYLWKNFSYICKFKSVNLYKTATIFFSRFVPSKQMTIVFNTVCLASYANVWWWKLICTLLMQVRLRITRLVHIRFGTIISVHGSLFHLSVSYFRISHWITNIWLL